MYTIKGKKDTLKELLTDDYKIVTQRRYDHEQKKQIFVDYINIPCAFDTESTSTMSSYGKKFGFVWCWQLGINGAAYIGRKLEDFVQAMHEISSYYKLGENRKMIFYVHNLQHDFQFIRHLFKWTRLFAREEKSVIEAEIKDLGIIFRCSLFLCGCSLELVGKNLTKYKVEKQVGDLDYNLVRHYLTPYTQKEAGYLINDVMVIMSRIQCEIEEAGGKICDIPLTKTGKVRQYCRKHCLESACYKKTIRGLTMTPDMYAFCKRAFQGGFVHASWLKSDVTLVDVASDDFTSAYPACMLLPVYPMSTGEKIMIKDRAEFDRIRKTHCVIFNCRLRGVHEKFVPEHYISSSKCYSHTYTNKDGVQVTNRGFHEKAYDGGKTDLDNGRIIQGEDLAMTITELDLDIIERCYDIDEIIFGTAYIFKRGYLPKELIECVLHFYEQKTQLKDVHSDDGSIEANYQLFKEFLNSIFGCSVTDPVCDDILYTDDDLWKTEHANVAEAIDVYNNSRNRFLYYPWGVYITAANRANLWTGIFELGYDYGYSDTDSVKYQNPKDHEAYFEKYNKWITAELQKCCAIQGLDPAKLSPLDTYGKPHPLGEWDYETKDFKNGCYSRFKTLGAKRYLVEYEKDGETTLKCTIAGANKKETSKWLAKQPDPFETFTDAMCVPEEYAGRNILCYQDEEITDVVVDYQGTPAKVTAFSGVHFSRSDYHLTLAPVYAMLLGGREEKMIG